MNRSSKLIRLSYSHYIRRNFNRSICIAYQKVSKIPHLKSISQANNILEWRLNYVRFARHYSSSDLPQHYKVPLPALSPTMEMGTIVSWEKNEGDVLIEGDLLAEIETDKATMGFETPEEGYLAKIMYPAGSKDIKVGKLLCIIVSNAGDVAAFKDFAPSEDIADSTASATAKQPTPAPAQQPAPPPAAPVQPVTSAPAPVTQAPVTSPQTGAVFASPHARTVAGEKGLDLNTIANATGLGRTPETWIQGSDVEKYMSAVPAAEIISAPPVIPGAAYIDTPTSNIRKIIAARLCQSKQNVPHYYLMVDVEMDNILHLREQFNEHLKKDNVKLSVNDFIIKASALACKRIPEANSSWMETFIRQYNQVDVSVAVSTDKGLITPIVFKADEKGLVAISTDIQALAAKAREGKLQPHEFQGGTFSVSNLGMFGIKSFSAIINPPQSCILAVGGTQKTLIPDPDSETGYRTANMMTVTLSCDHRTVDGAVGAKWLKEFKNFLEKPSTMLL